MWAQWKMARGGLKKHECWGSPTFPLAQFCQSFVLTMSQKRSELSFYIDIYMYVCMYVCICICILNYLFIG